MASTEIFIFLLHVFIVFGRVPGHKWETAAGFSRTDPIKTERDCDSLKFLTYQQRKICQNHLDFMEAVREGAREALEECKYQFRNRRWNCSSFDDKELYGGFLRTGTKETAFLYSILAAGLTQSVARACSLGKLKKCGCDRTLSGMSEEGFEWTGCSDNVAYGSAFTLRFLDSREHLRKRSLIPRALMNLHNNNIGRKTVEKNMKIQCKCHGVSGSCELKTCWKTLPDFRLVGNELRSRYDRSTRVVAEREGRHTELIPATKNDNSEYFQRLKKVDNKNIRKNRVKSDKKNSNAKVKKMTSPSHEITQTLISTTSTTTVPTTTPAVVTNNITKSLSTINITISKINKQYINREKRFADDESQRKQRKNKVWISHGRDSISRRQDVGNNKKTNNNNENTRTEPHTPHNHELARYPRMPMDSESKKEKSLQQQQQSQNRRLREERKERIKTQRKRRERIIKRQRQQMENDLRLSETTPISQDHMLRGRQEGHHSLKENSYFRDHRLDDPNLYLSNAEQKDHGRPIHAKENSFDQQMVFLDLSPDYCGSDIQTGSLGTQGRSCSIDGTEGNCSSLCCGRGYSVKRSVITERCHCRFQWCCEVKCQKCRREVVEYTCR